MGGDLKKIQTVGRYMIEVWRAAGMNMDNVEFIWASEAINRCVAALMPVSPACLASPLTAPPWPRSSSNEYWLRVMDIARKFNVTRVRAGRMKAVGDWGDRLRPGCCCCCR